LAFALNKLVKRPRNFEEMFHPSTFALAEDV
jgi:hypothetical protein